ncbi:carboxylate--amine ligase [Halobium salinum]|uniref:Carboxylate--amine ligase n=1 Tax=Halobium salinum TaxID=1364940 RepID=A0ABD5P9Y9_9EURY|nr:carboxylate--amine ligase [Halobium salinum]
MTHVNTEAAVVPASRYPHGYASVRSLATRGIRAVAAVANPTLPVTTSRFCDEVVTVPPSYDLVPYRDALLDLAARPDVRTILPHRPQDPYVLSKHADAFDPHVDLVVPPFETLRTVHDRKRLMEVVSDAGVSVPETRLLDEAAGWETDRIVKSRYNLLAAEYVDSFTPTDSRIVKTVKHLPAGESVDVDALCEKMGHVPIVQEYVAGADEYVFGALYDRGEALATFGHRQLREDSYAGGGGVYRESVRSPELDAAGRRALDALDWHGLACLEFVEDAETGEFTLVEINPRMWQSLATAVRAGADFPYWYWLLATGRSDRIDPDYRVGVGTHYLYGELEHLVSVLREDSAFVARPSVLGTVASIARSWVERPQFDDFHLDDPSPALRQVRNEFVRVVGRRLGRE